MSEFYRDPDSGDLIPTSGIPQDSKNMITTFISDDEATPSAWKSVNVLASGERHLSIFQKISKMFSNIRYLYNLLGTTDISGLGSDVKTAIANIGGITVKGVEKNSTASQAYAAGEYLVFNNKLYKVTNAIAQNGTITVGTNISANYTNVGAELATLNTQLSDLNASKVSFSAMGTDNTYSGEASTIKNAIHMLNTNRSTFPQAKVFTTTFQSGGVHTIIGKFYESQYNYGNFIMLTLNGEVVSLKYYDGNWSYKYVSGADGYTAFNPT